MLSYQHLYHAGNNADCHKHGILCLLLARLKEKETPFSFTDTHSGRGLYDLTCFEAAKTNEFSDGIARIWNLDNWPASLAPYQKIIHDMNKKGGLHYYPGSPAIAAKLSRAQDRLSLYEFHPQELEALQENMGDEKRAQCHFTNGWEALNHPAPPENRGMVLIDPSYELKEDYELMAERLVNALKKWRNGMFVVWYPLLSSGAHHRMIEKIQESGIRKVMVSEIIFNDPDTKKGMYGSGMLIVNPPWQIEEQIADAMDWLVEQIGQSHECYWAVPE
jgi:23S rRNA (adenine2030-N6)-methyltransferase